MSTTTAAETVTHESRDDLKAEFDGQFQARSDHDANYPYTLFCSVSCIPRCNYAKGE